MAAADALGITQQSSIQTQQSQGNLYDNTSILSKWMFSGVTTDLVSGRDFIATKGVYGPQPTVTSTAVTAKTFATLALAQDAPYPLFLDNAGRDSTGFSRFVFDIAFPAIGAVANVLPIMFACFTFPASSPVKFCSNVIATLNDNNTETEIPTSSNWMVSPSIQMSFAPGGDSTPLLTLAFAYNTINTAVVLNTSFQVSLLIIY